MSNFVVAIDGPAGAGKSTVARSVAERLSIVYVDTGAMYRAVALYALEAGIDPDDTKRLLSVLDNIDIDVICTGVGQRVYLNGIDVSDRIRTDAVSMGASAVAAIPEVRIKLVQLQRQLAREQSVIMDGRDIGTYVFPNADVKIYLTASAEKRANRRYTEYIEKGIAADMGQVLEDIRKRDSNDSTRSFAPLAAADDAILVDTTELSVCEAIDAVADVINREVGNH